MGKMDESKMYLKEIIAISSEYSTRIKADMVQRIEFWGASFEEEQLRSVIGALIARQITLACEFSNALSVWNSHVAPIIQRCMVDVYITLSWIFKDPRNRAAKYVEFGLGQVKLQIEHRKKQMEADGYSVVDDPGLGHLQSWLSSQEIAPLVEVNVGSWSGKSVREMAEEAGCIDFYNYSFAPLSGCVHSTWAHVSRMNLVPSANPLHRLISVPVVQSLPFDLGHLEIVARYVNKTFRLFDEQLGLEFGAECSYDWLITELESLHSEIR